MRIDEATRVCTAGWFMLCLGWSAVKHVPVCIPINSRHEWGSILDDADKSLSQNRQLDSHAPGRLHAWFAIEEHVAGGHLSELTRTFEPERLWQCGIKEAL